MKILVFLSLIVMTLLSSCGKDLKPDNKVHGTSFIRDNGGSDQDAVILAPTWGQANAFAAERGDAAVYKILAFLLFAALVVLTYVRFQEPSWAPRWVASLSENIGLGVVAVLFVLAWKGTASNIKFNNNKKIPQAQYDHYMKVDGSTRAIWDSLNRNGHIVGGNYDKYKK